MGGLVEVKMMLFRFTIISIMTFMVVVIMTIMVVVVTFFIIMAMVCMWVGLDRHHLDRQSVREIKSARIHSPWQPSQTC